ncbi:hypothetical protein Rsub_00130 [Raphidocelis subcapitata]|uniref:F-box domain-containing protein n=1 Tax=Raphidocelis subcapitata TaxID=307507 RepID=A0A2V0NKB2_9CHLO|nr:hypothetical protein Rsub_00130 [Raphidocelis subcapitata]|eukprot:GBF87419.1 hypothetical protein Rsub_00130 [Raphidocelis subcapitata]
MSTAQVLAPAGVHGAFSPPPRPWLSLYGVLLKPPPSYYLEDDGSLALIQRQFTDEMMTTIFSRLGPYAMGRAACVCRQWRYLAKSPKLWEAACRDALSPPAHRDIAADQLLKVLAHKFRCSWQRLFLEVPHVRFDGVYVARNTYIRVGAVELHRHSQTVFLACYYRYYRFFPNGQMLYRTSPHVLKAVVRSLARTPAALQAARANPAANRAAADDAQHVHSGRYCVADGRVRTVIVYPNARGTEVRARLALRSTSPGACNRLDVESLCTYDWETRTSSPFPTDPGADEDEAAYVGQGAERRAHTRGLATFMFVPWEEVMTSMVNLPVSKMDVMLTG